MKGFFLTLVVSAFWFAAFWFAVEPFKLRIVFSLAAASLPFLILLCRRIDK